MNFEVENGPFLKSKNKTSKMMLHLFIALLPIIIFSFYKNGIIPYQKGLTDITNSYIIFNRNFICNYFLKKRWPRL